MKIFPSCFLKELASSDLWMSSVTQPSSSLLQIRKRFFNFDSSDIQDKAARTNIATALVGAIGECLTTDTKNKLLNLTPVLEEWPVFLTCDGTSFVTLSEIAWPSDGFVCVPEEIRQVLRPTLLEVASSKSHKALKLLDEGLELELLNAVACKSLSPDTSYLLKCYTTAAEILPSNFISVEDCIKAYFKKVLNSNYNILLLQLNLLHVARRNSM